MGPVRPGRMGRHAHRRFRSRSGGPRRRVLADREAPPDAVGQVGLGGEVRL